VTTGGVGESIAGAAGAFVAARPTKMVGYDWRPAMSMIFPGMDPYLEEPTYWVGVHDTLAVYIRDVLQPMLLPRYVASLEERVTSKDRRSTVSVPTSGYGGSNRSRKPAMRPLG